jgi:hypothetical protein
VQQRLAPQTRKSLVHLSATIACIAVSVAPRLYDGLYQIGDV